MTRTNRWWIGPAWFGFVVLGQLATGGTCPLTALSNALLKSAGGVEYYNLVAWVGGFIDAPAGYILSVLLTFFIVAPLLAGYLVRQKKEAARAFNSSRLLWR